MTPKLIAFSGTHGTGKTTAALTHAALLARENPNKHIGLLTEIASECPWPINKKATELSQYWIFTRQMSREIEMMRHYDLIVCDRSIVDSIAYTAVMGFDALAIAMRRLAQPYIQHYREIIFRTAERNPYWCDNGARESTDARFRQDVEDELRRIYLYLNPGKIIYV